MEIEKFKNLFFDNDQYNIFEHLPKPLLYDKDIYKIRKDHKLNLSLSHMEAFWRKKANRKEHSLMYNSSLDNLKHKEKLDAIDERLLEMIEDN